MDRTYTILLNRRGGSATRWHRDHAAFGQPFDSPTGFLSEPPRPAIHRERLTAAELQELAEEPDFVAAAEVMCTRLLSPVADEESGPGITAIAGGKRHQSWGIGAVGADCSKYSGAEVTIAMLDTGIDSEHRAFRDVDLIEKDFTGLGNGDESGHGTHAAGVVFGRNVDGVRIGVAPGVRQALIGKVLGPDGGNSEMLARGLLWAHERGAHVIGLSVGLDFAATVARRVEEGWANAPATAAALEAYCANLRLLDRLLHMLRMQEPFTGGSVIVAAAGNDSSRGRDREFVMAACPPCGVDKVVSVGALDWAPSGTGFRVAGFSNCGVGITAPGRSIVSAAAGGGLKAQSGTGAAAPHVAGVAALWWQAIRQTGVPANATLVRGKLLASARRDGFSLEVYPGERGAGRVAAPLDGSAVASLRPAAVNPPPPEPLEAAEMAWLGEGMRRAAFEPISLEVGGSAPVWPGRRRPS